ncbi:MAG: hypothetical protein IJ800_01225 [Clostridia bacterium]|nr:hypothetical protein [Clostridia bacterium]
MEKFGLFDLIEKFNASAKGKNDLSQARSVDDNVQAKNKSDLLRSINVPAQYAMNKKMEDFINKHDAISLQIDKNLTKTKKRGRPPKKREEKIAQPNEKLSPSQRKKKNALSAKPKKTSE